MIYNIKNHKIIHCIKPNWPAPTHVHALSTTRPGGRSQGSYASFNLAMHVGDHAQAVTHNRLILQQNASLPCHPDWLQQVHSNRVVQAEADTQQLLTHTPKKADASYTHIPHVVCAVLTADCLPLLLCNQQGSSVAAVHAGWRGLADGIIANTLKALSSPPESLLAWLGPCISPSAYRVKKDVYQYFVDQNKDFKTCFKAIDAQHWEADLQTIAVQQLQQEGVRLIYRHHACTYYHSERFFSYRRDKTTGRMASLIWIG